MNIEKIFYNPSTKDSDKLLYASSFRRGFAAAIDMTIVLFLRAISAQILGMLYVTKALQDFLTEFRDKFGTEFAKNNQDHIAFIAHHKIFWITLSFYAAVVFIGALYYALLNSSAWEGTIGKRLMKIVIEKEDGSRLSFGTSLAHYFLSILPFAYIIYIIMYQLRNNLNFFQTVTASDLNVFFGILFLGWTQIHLITRKKVTAYDLICKTIAVNKKIIAAKFPWSKI
jgi:uncharacterized RDD family membrane protein YckC